MSDTLTILAAASCLCWFWLLLCRDGFWRADQRQPANCIAPSEWPAIVAIVPARNEADVIATSIASLQRQDYPGDFSILLVDDHSDDGTAAKAIEAAPGDRLTVLSAPPLPAGWTGKLAALDHGTREARRRIPGHRYILFTDADIAHPSDGLRRLVAQAERDRRDIVSLMVRLHCESAWERLLIPAFVFFFQKLYPFAAVNDESRTAAAAAGGCMLVRREALDAAGGLDAIRGALIDDCALAAAIKRRHGRLWLGLAEDTRSVRPYRGLGEIWSMVARTAYTQLHHSPLELAGAVAGMAVVYLAGPVLFVLYPWHDIAYASSFGLLGWLLMACAFLPTLRYYRQPAALAAALPVIAVIYLLMTIDSARRHLMSRGGEWKGRTYP